MKKEIDKEIMRRAFDYIENPSYWQNKVDDIFAELELEEEAELAETESKRKEEGEIEHNQKEKESQKTQTRRLWQYAAAASVLLLAALGIWAYYDDTTQTNKKPTPKPYIQQGNNGDKSLLVAVVSVDELLAKSVNDFQATTTRKGSNDVDNWLVDFQAGNYTTVIQTLESVGKKRTVEQTYFLAQAYLKIDPKNTLKAQPLFKIVSAANSDNALDALWSYALICVLDEPNEVAKTALDEVIEKSNAHKEEAQKLRLTLK